MVCLGVLVILVFELLKFLEMKRKYSFILVFLFCIAAIANIGINKKGTILDLGVSEFFLLADAQVEACVSVTFYSSQKKALAPYKQCYRNGIHCGYENECVDSSLGGYCYQYSCN